MKYHHIEVIVNSTIKPKDNFITSTIRGSYGHFLKAQTCIESSYDCGICQHVQTCIYAKLYNKNNTTNSPAPIRFDAKLYTKNYNFDIYLYDESIILRPILSALQFMLQAKTITEDALSFPKSDIYLNGRRVELDKRRHIKLFDTTPKTLEIDSYKKEVSLSLETPLYIKEGKGYKTKNTLTLDDILLSIHRRKRSLEYNSQDNSLLDYTPEYTPITIAKDLKIFSENIYSYEQQKPIPLFGLIGKMVFTNLDKKSFELLRYGELLGLGKNVTKGQGAIKLIY